MSDDRLHILFIAGAVSGFNVSHGGHYYSCATLARALSEHVRTSVLTVGDFTPDALAHSLPEVHGVHFARLPTPATWSELSALVGRLRPTHLHAFDVTGCLVARLLGLRFRLPVVLTKPGGPNDYSPRCPTVIAFSRENFEDLERRHAGHDVAVHLLPNRILPIPADEERIAALRPLIGNDRPIFMRIARFGRPYRTSILQTIQLAEDLCADGYPCRAVIIGAPQDPAILAEITARQCEHVTVISDGYFTRGAAALLPAADFVCGTGRNFMEAALQGRILMTTMNGMRYPLLVDEANFEALFRTNFSPRNVVVGASDAATLAAVTSLLRSERPRAEARAFAHRVGERFDVRAAIPAYLDIYARARPPALEPLDLLEHGARTAKLLLRMIGRRRRYRKALAASGAG